MADLITNEEELEFQRKVKARRRFRGLLIIVNTLLVCYLFYAIGDAVINLIKEKDASADTVALCRKSERESLKLYEKHASSTVDGDFAVYGDSLLLSEDIYDIENPKLFPSLQLINVCSTDGEVLSSLKYNNHGQYLNKGINLFTDNGNEIKNIEAGDYFFYANYQSSAEKGKVVQVDTKQDIKIERYSLPDSNGKRIKTTIYTFTKKPILIMNVQVVTKVPDDYYDFVIGGTETAALPVKAKLEENNYKVKIIEKGAENDSIQKKMFLTNATYAIYLQKSLSEKITVSSKVDSLLEKSDEELFSQLGGYAYSNGALLDYFNNHTPGIYTYKIDHIETVSESLIDAIIHDVKQ